MRLGSGFSLGVATPALGLLGHTFTQGLHWCLPVAASCCPLSQYDRGEHTCIRSSLLIFHTRSAHTCILPSLRPPPPHPAVVAGVCAVAVIPRAGAARERAEGLVHAGQAGGIQLQQPAGGSRGGGEAHGLVHAGQTGGQRTAGGGEGSAGTIASHTPKPCSTPTQRSIPCPAATPSGSFF